MTTDTRDKNHPDYWKTWQQRINRMRAKGYTVSLWPEPYGYMVYQYEITVGLPGVSPCYGVGVGIEPIGSLDADRKALVEALEWAEMMIDRHQATGSFLLDGD